MNWQKITYCCRKVAVVADRVTQGYNFSMSNNFELDWNNAEQVIIRFHRVVTWLICFLLSVWPFGRLIAIWANKFVLVDFCLRPLAKDKGITRVLFLVLVVVVLHLVHFLFKRNLSLKESPWLGNEPGSLRSAAKHFSTELQSRRY